MIQKPAPAFATPVGQRNGARLFVAFALRAVVVEALHQHLSMLAQCGGVPRHR